MITDLHIQDCADLRVSTDPPSHVVDSSLRGKVYSRHDPFISLSASSSRVMKKCPFSMFFEKPAVEQSLVNFSCSGSSANFYSSSRNKFPCTSTSVWEVRWAMGNSVGIAIDSKLSFAAGFPYLVSLWLILQTNPLLLRRPWPDWRNLLFEESIQWCHHYRWREWI